MNTPIGSEVPPAVIRSRYQLLAADRFRGAALQAETEPALCVTAESFADRLSRLEATEHVGETGR